MSETSTAITTMPTPAKLTVVELLLAHFWKLFSLLSLGIVAWMVYEASEFRSWLSLGPYRGFPTISVQMNHPSSGVSFEDTNHILRGGYDGKQLKPATVQMKSGQQIEGFLYSIDHEFVCLSTSTVRFYPSRWAWWWLEFPSGSLKEGWYGHDSGASRSSSLA